MKNLKDLLITVSVSIIVIIAGFTWLENHYRHELQKMGWLPASKLNVYPYSRRISGYTVSENTPNFDLIAYDDKFHPVPFKIDSNGFKTDEAVLQKEKDSNTIRIFITGGSTAWGSIESRNVMKDTTYPGGNYIYESTIAGKLQTLLQAQYPAIKFEVIDAAVVHYRFHQSFALYFEKLHDFNPDIIINIDGHNDLGSLLDVANLGDPYPGSIDQMEEELELATTARLPQWPYTLVYYNFKYVRQQNKLIDSQQHAVTPVSNNRSVIKHQATYQSYQAIRPYLHFSKKTLWLIDSYGRQLRADGVYSIFCLQPTLQRRVYQKELSPIELRFRTFLEKITIADTMNTRAFVSQSATFAPYYQLFDKAIGVDKYWYGVLKDEYLLNDISPVFDSIVNAYGGAYVDVNKAMVGMGADKEFYVDYCHLTPFGNEFVAQLLLKKVELYMEQKRKDIPKQ